jgi:valyl-tRNA synthetase
MSEIPKAYEPAAVEERWYRFWLEQRCFVAEPGRVTPGRPAYSIVIPPPNVTGMLHMGHVLNNTIQDILARKARMEGREVLWLPGTDHAGIATEGMVEKQLRKEEKRSKRDIGREEFLKRVWVWKEKHGGIIIEQLKKLGCSCDWSRERFTMDPAYVRCVQSVFVELYRKGLIYRGRRMVNWCPASLTALSDEEVDMETQQGLLWHFRVELADEPGTFLTIATTRPETIPGDTAIAVNPKDPRYAHLIGRHALRPLPAQLPPEKKRIPIIGDAYVDAAFGTGVLKVTPAHDRNDFEIGQRHGLPVVDIMSPNGTMNELAGETLAGLDRLEARTAAVQRLKELNALVKEEPYENKVGISQRAKVPIEPRLSDQWFLRYPSVEPSKACVAEGRLRFYPERWTKVYDYWLANIQDWCISRQLWWGHRVPVWSASVASPEAAAAIVANLRGAFADLDQRAAVRVEGQTLNIATADAEIQRALETVHGLEQDADVLDTWFSSWLWPFATMGWPEATPTLRAFYPTTDLVTGPDIIFFWVARMIMAGYEFMGDLPFRNVYFTGIIRDKQGRKMSKTLGNSPDPLVLIERYGADALRFGTLRSAPLGQDVLFDEKDVELGRNFCNKLWNACRFRQLQPGPIQSEIRPELLDSDDRWILLRLDQAIEEIHQAFLEYRFSGVTQTLQRFFWSEYCDWYVEASKAALGRPSERGEESGAADTGGAGTAEALRVNKLAVIDFVLGHTLRLFHPLLPFITEELWHGLGYHQDMPEGQGGASIMTAPWPKPFGAEVRAYYGLDADVDQFVGAKFALVTQARNLRREFNIPSSKKVRFVLCPAIAIEARELGVLRLLLNAAPLDLAVDATDRPAKGTPSILSSLGELYLPLEGLIDVAAERARLEREINAVRSEIAKVQAKLGSAAFTQKAPPAVLAEHEQRLKDWQAKLQRAQASQRALGGGD